MTVPSRSALQVHVTPAGSFSDPLTPPPTDKKAESTSTILRIIKEIKKAKTGRGKPWAVYKLDAKGFRDLQHRLQGDESLAGFAEHKLRYTRRKKAADYNQQLTSVFRRYDYFLSSCRFVLRMPGDTHEHFTASLVEEIQRQLKAFQGSLADLAKDIKTGASSRIVFQDSDYGSHDPDASFKYRGAQFPSVVIEVSHSQKKRDLPHLADDYILGSQSNIQRVIGLDIEYEAKRTKLATISVWVPGTTLDSDGETALIAEQIVDNQAFRDRDGNTISSPDSALRIPLRDFTLENCTAMPEGEIVISAQVICDFLHDAETEALIVKSNTGIVKPLAAKTWSKTKRRAPTPPEELNERDEKRFRAEESQAEEKYVKSDSSFGTPSVGEESG